MKALGDSIARQWDESIVPRLIDYIRIPAKSPHFDPEWEAHGHIERVDPARRSVGARATGARAASSRSCGSPGRTPVLYLRRARDGVGDETVLLYGHLDKQPEMTGWREGFGPWMPVIEDGKLYGRGGADDGYAVFASLAAIARAAGAGHAARALRRADRDAARRAAATTCRPTSSARAAHGARRLRRRPRFGLRQLRPAVGARRRCAASPTATLTRRQC